ADTYGFRTNSLTVAGAAGNALLTPFDDDDDLLLWFVARRPLLAASAVFAVTLGPTVGGGFGLHQAASTAAVSALERAVSTGQTAKAANAAYGSVGVGDWFFAAGYTGTRAAVPDEGIEVFCGPATLAQAAISPATADIISGRKIGLGNGYYTGQGTTSLEF